MKPLDDQLDRLLRSAATAPQPATGEAPFAMQTRVLAHWRATQGESGDFLVAWFRRAALAGCALAVATLAWTYHEQSSIRGGEMATADSAMNMGVEQ